MALAGKQLASTLLRCGICSQTGWESLPAFRATPPKIPHLKSHIYIVKRGYSKMAGNSNSGRKTWKFEAETKDVLELSFGILSRALTATDDEFSLEKKAELASRFIVKRIPNIDAPDAEQNGNRILIYVERADNFKNREQVLSAFGTSENPRITEAISNSDSGTPVRKIGASSE